MSSSDVLLYLRKQQRKYRKLSDLLRKVGTFLSAVLTGLALVSYYLDLFGLWIVQVVITVLSIVATIVWTMYLISRRVLAQIRKRIREVRGQVVQEITIV